MYWSNLSVELVGLSPLLSYSSSWESIGFILFRLVVSTFTEQDIFQLISRNYLFDWAEIRFVRFVIFPYLEKSREAGEMGGGLGKGERERERERHFRNGCKLGKPCRRMGRRQSAKFAKPPFFYALFNFRLDFLFIWAFIDFSGDRGPGPPPPFFFSHTRRYSIHT